MVQRGKNLDLVVPSDRREEVSMHFTLYAVEVGGTAVKGAELSPSLRPDKVFTLYNTRPSWFCTINFTWQRIKTMSAPEVKLLLASGDASARCDACKTVARLSSALDGKLLVDSVRMPTYRKCCLPMLSWKVKTSVSRAQPSSNRSSP